MIGSRWRVEDNGTWAQLEADFQPMCRFRGIPLVCTNIKLFKFPLNEPAYWERGEINGHAVDVDTRCPQCGLNKMFGVAVEEEHWFKLFVQAKGEYEQVA